jgi:hypothetical protein
VNKFGPNWLSDDIRWRGRIDVRRFFFTFVKRLMGRAPTPISEEIGSVKKVLGKLRKGEPMSKDELDFATQTIADRRSLMAYSIPAAVFTIGCFYVFGWNRQGFESP